MFRCHNVIQFFSCVCLCANYSSVVRVPPDLSFSSIWWKKEKWLFQYNFLPVHTLVGRRSPTTCISLTEGQGPKGQGLTLGKQLLVQERNYLVKSLKQELHIFFHKTDCQIVSLFQGKIVISFVPCTYYRTYDSCSALLCPIFIYLF